MKGHKMSESAEKRTEYSFRPNSDEMNTIWENRIDQDELIENLSEWYKRGVTVASLNLRDIKGSQTKAEAARLFVEIAQVVNLELVSSSGTMEIERPQTRAELAEHAKYELSGEIAKVRFTQYKTDKLWEMESNTPDAQVVDNG